MLAMPPLPGAPTTEQGSARGHMTPGGLSGVPRWQSFVDESEHVPDLQWPLSVNVYDRMRSDAQVACLYAGLTQPIRAYTYELDPQDADPALVALLAEDLQLPVMGEPARAARLDSNRVSFGDHLRHVLLALAYGHYYFEQVGTIDDAGRFRYRKLAPRVPASLTGIEANAQGGLEAINQGMTRITADRLVGYVWDQEAGSWTGRSMLRPLYRPWLVKDRLIRVDAIKHERGGMGLPTIEAHDGATPDELDELERMATAIRVGEQSGGVTPYGSKLRLVGTEGSIPDTLASIRYHDESMARALLMMFVQLGQTQTGSRALGDTFVDYVAQAQHAVAAWFAGVFTEHVIQDWFDWNVGTDAPAPRLVFHPPADERTSTADLVSLISAGAITVDPDLEDALRSRTGLPAKPDTEPAPAAPAAPVPAPGAPAVASGAGMSASRVRAARARTFRRDLTEQEVAATTDFQIIAARLEDRTTTLVRAWGGIRDGQVNELHAQIMDAAGDLNALAAIQPTVQGSDLILREQTKQASAAFNDARAELARQGAKLPAASKLDDVVATLAPRAEATATIMATDLGQAASRAAIRLAGPQTSAQDLADQVVAYIEGLTDRYPQDMLGAALMAAENSARFAVMQDAPPASYYASELLDDATCAACEAIDGTEYDSLEDAEADYPTGGYLDCEGGVRCRGTIVAVLDEQNDPTAPA